MSATIDPFSTEITCSKVVCPTSKFTNIPYPSNPAYYVFCSGDEKVMFKCPDVVNHHYDTVSQSCKYKCIKAGSYEDRERCTNYYVCSDGTGEMKSDNIKCPDGYYFRNGECVFGTCTNAIDVTPE